MKTCIKCGETKPFTEFYKKSSAKDGYDGACKECKREYCKQYHQKNKEAIHERQHRWRQENKEVINENSRRYYHQNKEKLNQRSKQYYHQNKEKLNQHNRQYREERNAQQPGCIYQIVNSINGRVYIGETTRGEIRWIKHLSSLRRNCHENPNLQSDFNEFGEDVFGWSIIQELPKDKKMLRQEEKNTIQRFLAEGKQLYNVYKN